MGSVGVERGLANRAERPALGCRDGMILFDPERPPLLPVDGIDLRDYLARLERSLIQQALADTHHVVARAAERLHLRRTTLVEKMRKYGLNRSGMATPELEGPLSIQG